MAERDIYYTLQAAMQRFQRHADRYDRLLAQKWLLPEGAALQRIIKAMKAEKLAQVRLLFGPQEDLGSLLAQVESEAHKLDEWQQAHIREFRRQYIHFSGFAAPGAVDHYEQTLDNTEHLWLESFYGAKQNGIAAAFREQIPIIETAFAARRAVAEKPAQLLGVSISEACVDFYNPGIRNDEIDRMIAQQKDFYPGFFATVRDFIKAAKPPLPLPPIPGDKQMELFRQVKRAFLECAGWDKDTLEQSGIIINVHRAQTGFSWGSPQHIHLALEIKEDEFIPGLANTLHECGHLLYLLETQRLPPEARGLPAGTFNGFGLHESAAIYFEDIVKHRDFMELVAPLIRKTFAVDGPEWSAENLYRLVNFPQPDDKRLRTDAVTLGPHIAWRVLAERHILDGTMDVSSLPGFRSRMMEEYTGVSHDPAHFMIRESHWPEGLMGYFWAYITGAAASAMLHQEFGRQGYQGRSAASSLKDYLQPYYAFICEHIFMRGCMLPPVEHLTMALGAPLNLETYHQSLTDQLAAYPA